MDNAVAIRRVLYTGIKRPARMDPKELEAKRLKLFRHDGRAYVREYARVGDVFTPTRKRQLQAHNSTPQDKAVKTGDAGDGLQSGLLLMLEAILIDSGISLTKTMLKQLSETIVRNLATDVFKELLTGTISRVEREIIVHAALRFSVKAFGLALSVKVLGTLIKSLTVVGLATDILGIFGAIYDAIDPRGFSKMADRAQVEQVIYSVYYKLLDMLYEASIKNGVTLTYPNEVLIENLIQIRDAAEKEAGQYDKEKDTQDMLQYITDTATCLKAYTTNSFGQVITWDTVDTTPPLSTETLSLATLQLHDMFKGYDDRLNLAGNHLVAIGSAAITGVVTLSALLAYRHVMKQTYR